ncbi:tonsoku-like protein [Topomyia yanbarensis]|uniref:tonsoku-like protein n=1 Tax=Topomyia yanbarensis TaxID=2498891 RepID=UPI00273CACB3|nr:tonsoku-like protein [Topomyia yanbarensis]
MSSESDMEEQKLLRRKKKSSEAGNLQQLAETCRKLGELYSDRGEHRKALNEFKLVSKAYHRLEKPMEVGRANRFIGEMFMLLDEFEKALQYEKVYLEIARRQEDDAEVQRAYATIGRAYLLKGQSCDDVEAAKKSLDEADKAFQKSLKLSRDLKGVGKVEQLDMEARSLLNLGVTKEHQGNFEQAVEYMQKAIKIAQNNELHELLHQCYISVGLLFDVKQNNHSKALKVLNEALEVSSRLHNKASKMCETLLIKAHVLIKMGDFQSAKQALKKAYRLKTPVVSDAENIERQLKVLVAICRIEDQLITAGSNEYAKKKRFYELMGDGACRLENYGKAIDYYLKMLECAQLNGEIDLALIPIYVSLYQTYKDNKQYEDALIYLWKEYNLIANDPREAFNTLLSIAEVYEIQNKPFFETEGIYRRAREEAKKMKSLKMEGISLKRCIALLKKHGMDLMVENLEKEAIETGIDWASAENVASDDSDEEQDQTETSIEFAINTPDIGEDVNLSELSNSDGESSKKSEAQSDSRSTRKRGTSFQVRKNNKGETQLHQACISGNKMLVQKLLEQGHPVNIRDHAGWLPLHEACIHGHKEIVEMLLDRGAHINDKGGTSCDGITPLYDACSNGNLEVVELLLDRGANCTLRTDSGDTTVSVLDVWFKSVQKKLLDEHILYYNTIRDRMMVCLENAGVRSNELAAMPEAIEQETITGGTRSSRRQAARICRSDSDSEKEDARTVCTASSNRSSGYGSTVDTAPNSSRKRPTKNRSISPDLSSDSEDFEKEASGSSFREKSFNQSTGVEDYRTAMKVLRKGTTVRTQIVSPLKDPNPGPAKRSAYMRQEEVGDDWLDDDLGQSSKRQKFLSDKSFPESNRSVRRIFEPDDTLPISDRTITSTGLEYDSDSPERDDRASSEERTPPDALQMLMNASSKSFQRKPSGQQSARRNSFSGSIRNQVSLLDLGVSVSSRSSSPTPSLADCGLLLPVEQKTPVKDGSGVTSTVGSRTPTKVLPPNMVRVIIEGEPIDVSYDEDQIMELNVGWLINEVVKRYGIKHGKRPLMKLLRSDGGLCVNCDPLTTLLSDTDSIINTYVIEYEQLRSEQFYEDYCKYHNVEHLPKMKEVLIEMEDKGHLILHPDLFRGIPHQWDILFQILGFQSRIRKLDLSFNQLEDTEFQKLTEKLPALTALEKLNLSMNVISHKGIFALSSLIRQSPDEGPTTLSALMHLTELDLSRNPLLDQSLLVLSSVCQQLTQLTVLRLVSTAVTNLTFASPPLDISRFQVFDVSENNLNRKSIDYLFSKLNTRILTELNMRSLGKLKDFIPALTTTVQSNDFDMLRSLNLSNCGLTDTELCTILFALRTSAEKLKELDVSFNAKLTQKSLVEVLESFTSHTLESVRFLQNPLVLKDWGENMVDVIHYDRSKCYPKLVELMAPLRLDDSLMEDLRRKLSAFWEHIWSDRASVKVDELKITLLLKH